MERQRIEPAEALPERPPAPVAPPQPRRAPLTPAAVLALQRTSGNAAVTRALAREEAPATAEAPAPATGPADLTELVAIRDRATSRNAALQEFVGSARETIAGLRTYYGNVDAAYSAAFARYSGAVVAAAGHARSQQQLFSFFFGAGAAIGVSAFAQAMGPISAYGALAERYPTIVANAIPNVGSSGVSVATPEVYKGGGMTPSAALQPALRQLEGLQQVDQLSTLVLSLASPLPAKLLSTAVGAERLIGNARGAKAEPADQGLLAQLREADAVGAEVEPVLAELRERFAEIRQRAGRAAPEDPRVEHDIWVAWIASLDDPSVLTNADLERYFMKIGLDGVLGVDGALDRTPFVDPRGWHSDTRMHAAAKAQMTGLSVRWEHYMLLDPYGG